jgi:hypothetical protein
VDRILARPYDAEVPFGASGERVWAISPQGWGFRDGVHLLSLPLQQVFDVHINSQGVQYEVAQAEYRPSHVRMRGAPATALPNALTVAGEKWITEEDVLVTRLRIANPGATAQPIFVRMDSELSGTTRGYADERQINGYALSLRACGTDGRTEDTQFLLEIAPGQTRTFTFACAIAGTPGEAEARLQRILRHRDPLKEQIAQYQGWFDSNTAAFECSDPLISKLYYHRWYLLKKNSLFPRLGILRHRTFSEGRWTSEELAQVRAWGAGHQVREARWLRDPAYVWGHLHTWTDNTRSDGLFSSGLTPQGRREGKSADWIASTVWDGYLVHPQRKRLEQMVDVLAANVRGYRRVYGWNDSPLLVAADHRAMDMAWQPAFFSFLNYRADAAEKPTPLRRVDLSAFHFANAQNVARIFRELGRDSEAAEMQRLADEVRNAAQNTLWNLETRWFHSVRASDYAKSPVREIAGLYPFAFGLVESGRGFEAVWEVVRNPAQFWTPWPLASVSKDCPAYAQSGWPIGPGGEARMWNGPVWPYANSLALRGMAYVLRQPDGPARLRQTYYDLFLSYTKAQFRNQDFASPWTGECYNGETGEWKTPQRDCFASTWIDALLTDLIGLIPRADNVLEIDPLLPEGVWTHYLLDGQHYRGHTLTILYDPEGKRYAPGIKGYVVYLDGRQIHHSARPTRLVYPMKE